MMRKIMAVSLVLVMALTLAACDGEDLPSAEELIEGMTQAVADVRTGEFDMELTMDMDVESEGESIDANVEMDASGATDIENYQMQMAMTVHVAATGEEDMDMELEMYLVDNTLYLMTDALGLMSDFFGMGPTWMKLDITELEELAEMEGIEGMPEAYWDQAELLEFQQEFFEASETEVIGSERVGGIDCYLLESNPDMEQLWQTVMEMYATTGLETTDMPEDFADYLDEMFDSFTQRLWVAKDTYLPMKAEVEMIMEFTAEEMGAPEEDGRAAVDLFMSVLIFNYNQPVSVEVPPEAENAIDILDFTDYMNY
jgi:hypothetical protein